MARYQFNEESPPVEWSERGTQLSQFIVRGFGFVLMLVGLWISLAVIAESWSLYKNPANIERLAKSIERGSNLDHALSRVSQPDQMPGADTADGSKDVEREVLGFRMSYFVAWIIAILLLMLVGRLAIAAVKTGGELVLHDAQIKKFARELVRESLKAKS
jgi:disulfide bond formation protein DsbB